MNLRRPTVIDQAQWALGAAVTALGGVLWGGRGALSSGVGALLAVLNFWAIRRLGARAVARVADGGSSSQAGALVAALVFKMTALFVLVWLAIRVFHLPVVPFALGISVLVVAILVAGPALAAESSAEDGALPRPGSIPEATAPKN